MPRPRKNKDQSTPQSRLDIIVNAIRVNVQQYTTGLAVIQRDTDTLAPQVAEAYDLFQEQRGEEATKLEFIKLFATKEQLANWPATDREAKLPESPVQILFNSVDYLLRCAAQMQADAEKEAELAKVKAAAEKQARKDAAAKRLAGDDADKFVEEAVQTAVEKAQAVDTPSRPTRDEIADTIADFVSRYARMQDLPEYEKFATVLLSLKYSETTIKSIIGKAAEKIQAATKEVHAAPAPALAAPVAEASQMQTAASQTAAANIPAASSIQRAPRIPPTQFRRRAVSRQTAA